MPSPSNFPPVESQRNAASRLLWLCQAAVKQETSNAEQCWGNVFQLGSFSKEARTPEISRLLVAAIDEIESVEEYLMSYGASEQTAKLALREPRLLMQTGNLQSTWKSTRGVWRGGGKVGLSLAADFMANDSTAIPEESWSELDGLVDELQEAAKSPELSQDLARFLRDHAQSVRRALRAFLVKGSVAFDPVLREVIELVNEQAEPDTRARALEFLRPLWSKLVPILMAGWRSVRAITGIATLVGLFGLEIPQIGPGTPPSERHPTADTSGAASQGSQTETTIDSTSAGEEPDSGMAAGGM